MDRREFLKSVATGATVAACPGLFVAGCDIVGPAPEAAAPAIDAAGQVIFPEGQYPQVEQPGGAVLLRPEGAEKRPILFVRVSESEYRSTNGLCTHLLCPVSYAPKRGVIECPCHGSRFSLDGTVLRKPAVTPLFVYPVRTDPVTRELVIDTLGYRAPPVDDDGKVRMDLRSFSELDRPNTTFAFTPLGAPEPILVVHLGGGQFHCVQAYSTASRTLLVFDASAQTLVDPSTGATYRLDGSVLEAPAGTGPLVAFPVMVEGAQLVIAPA